MAWHNSLGKYGEDKVACYLAEQGYTILERNWRVGHRELDFIVLDKEEIVVVEVKTRSSHSDYLFDLISEKKKMNLLAAGAAYLTKKQIQREIRFDLIVLSGPEMKLEHIQDAINIF